MQGLIDVFLFVVKKLEENNLPYMIVGSMASMVYGEPRMTHDLDLVIHLLPQEAQRLETLFPSEEFYCPPLEVTRAEIVHCGQFNLIHHDSGLKIDIIIRKKTEHALTEFTRRRKVPFFGKYELYLASPEDVIIKKMEYFREGGSQKHLKDIRGILAETPLDQDYLTHWVGKLSLEKEWEQVHA